MDLPHGLKGRQLAAWPEADRRYCGLKNIQTKEINIDGMNVRIQFNPSRAVSAMDRFILHGAGWGHGVGLCLAGLYRNLTYHCTTP